MSHYAPTPAGTATFATIGQRIWAYTLDSVFAGGAVIGGIIVAALLALLVQSPAVFLVGYVFAGAGYSIYVWYLTATRGYSPGKKLRGLRLVDASTLQPIGWWRVWLRGFVLGLILVCTLGIGAIVVAMLADKHARRQGWHDLAVGSVVVPETATRPTDQPSPPAAAAAPPSIGRSSIADLSTNSSAPAATSAPIGLTPVTVPPTIRPPVVPEPNPEAEHLKSAGSPPMLVGPPPGMGTISADASPDDSLVSADLIDEATRAASSRSRGLWSLAPIVGEPRTVLGQVLIGRDPDPSLVEGATVWPVDDPDRSVSKTHALVGVDGPSLWIEDHDSTNGVVLRRDGVDRELSPRTRADLEERDIVLLGDFEVTVRRG